jgi:DNA polymerase
MPALQTAEAKGYLPILSVHDEAITEVPDTDAFSAQGLVEILATNPPWAEGLPLAAAGFEARRYKKD